MRYVEDKKEDFTLELTKPVIINDKIVESGSKVTIYDEATEGAEELTKSVVIEEKVIAKGSFIKFGENKLIEGSLGVIQDDFLEIANQSFNGDYTKALESFASFVINEDISKYQVWTMGLIK